MKVLLTNATDLALYRMKKLAKRKIRTCEADALVDTGAVRSVIPPFIFEQLGLGLTGTRVADYADGRTVEVGVSEEILFQYLGRRTLEEALVLGDEVLLGQTFLESTDLMADCINKRLMPNPAHPNQPILKVK